MSDLQQKLNAKLKHADEADEEAGMSKSAPATAQLLAELRQWRFARSLVRVFIEVGNGQMYSSSKKNEDEARDLLDSWLLSFQLDYSKSMDSRYPLFPSSLCADDPVNQKLIDECTEKRFSIDRHNATEIFRELKDRLDQFLSTKHDDTEQDEREARTLRVRVEEDEKREAHVELEDFRSKHCWRVSFLVRNFGLVPTARMLMRYEALGTGSLQWGDPITVHNALHDEMGVRYEGFASPLNSKMIDKEDSRFCSLFFDTDEVFGSMGSFFEVDFTQCKGGWTVNPSFIEELLDRVASKVLDYLDTGDQNNWFFVTFPRWTDMPGWKRLANSRHRIHQFELEDGCFTAQDCYGHIFPPRNNFIINIFVMGHRLPEGASLQTIRDKLLSTDMDVVQKKWRETCHKELDKNSHGPDAAAGCRDAKVTDNLPAKVPN